jgi:urease accessory protein
MEPAVMADYVRTVDDVELFCRARLATSGVVNAAFASAAHRLWSEEADPSTWELLDAEYSARLPSEALRSASRSLGSGLRRLLHSMAPDAEVDAGWSLIARPAPHHPLVLGAAVAIAGGDAPLAAQAAALAAITGPASAAVRLLGLDPLATHAMLARLAPLIADSALACTESGDLAPELLPSLSAPALDLLADVHRNSEVRLFAS